MLIHNKAVPSRKSVLKNDGRCEQGVALLITLITVTIISIALIAFLVQTRLHRTMSFSSAGQARAESLARAALDTVINDYQGEIAEGSGTNTQYGVTVYRPYSAINAVPFRSGTLNSGTSNSGTSGIVRWSANGVPAWPQVTGTAPGPVRATADSTTTPSANGRYIDSSRWSKPALESSMPADFAPDWILFTRQGAMKNANALPPVSVLADSSPSNMNYVVGRYAFVVHDVSGLLDITVAGHSSNTTNLATADISRGGSTVLADLTRIPGLSKQSDVDNIVAWRNAYSSGTAATYNQFIFGSTNAFVSVKPTNNFLTVMSGDQTFLSRQDLLNYWKQQGLDPAALPYLTTFSRDLNAPSCVPPTLTGSNGYNYPSATNCDVLTIRFPADATLNTDSNLVLLDKNVAVKKGQPLIRRRFPLDRLAWIGTNGPDAGASSADIKLAFGLVWDSPNLRWVYTSAEGTGTTPATAINTLTQVAALPQPRDPDFFELLKAGILEGSLAKVSGNPTAAAWSANNNPPILMGAHDNSFDLQLMQIGVNIIDQSGTSPIPTSIAFNDGTPSAPAAGNGPEVVYGIKSLPYLFYMAQMAFRPQVVTSTSGAPPRSDIGAWLVPGFWDPHQNAIAASTYNPTQFRIRAIQGQIFTNYQYYVGSNPTASGSNGAIRTLSNSDAITFTRDATNNFTNGVILRTNFASSSFPADNQPTDATTGYDNGNPTVTLPSTPSGVVPVLHPGFVGFCSGLINDPDRYINGGANQNATALVAERQNIAVTGVPSFEVQCFDGSQWRTYQRWDYFASSSRGYYLTGNPPFSLNMNPNVYHLQTPYLSYFTWVDDPRTTRFGGTANQAMMYSGTSGDYGLWWDGGFSLCMSGLMRGGPGWLPQSKMSGYPASNSIVDSSLQCNTAQQGYTSANGNTLLAYQDRDGALRPGDAAIGSTGTNAAVVPLRTDVSTSPVNPLDRPVILNRPFRSVGELGYAYRGQPWKTLDFFSTSSADASLLDLFSVSDTTMTAGRVSLNTPYPQVLASIISGALQTELYASGTSSITASAAAQLSGTLVAMSGTSPFVNRSELVTKASTTSISASLPYPGQKTMREAYVRALSDTTTARTWNLMIDVIAQSGRYPSGSGAQAKFVIEGERRYWLHVAIDRYTGKIIDQKLEAVDE